MRLLRAAHARTWFVQGVSDPLLDIVLVSGDLKATVQVCPSREQEELWC